MIRFLLLHGMAWTDNHQALVLAGLGTVLCIAEAVFKVLP